MRRVFRIAVTAVLLAGCVSQDRHTREIVGKWDRHEVSSDLGSVHSIWEFSTDNRAEWITSVRGGKETMRDEGTYAMSGNKLVFKLNKWGTHSYIVECLAKNTLRLGDDSGTLEFTRMK